MTVNRRTKADVLIIGAGIIGLSIAYHLLTLQPKLSITVLEKEQILGLGSTGKCTGGIRYQFSSSALRQLSLLSRDFFRLFEASFETPIWYRETGYLMLATTEDSWRHLQITAERAVADGIPMKQWERENLIRDFPYLNELRFFGGTLCPWDAYADPYAVLAALYAAVRRQGCHVHLGCPVSNIIKNRDQVLGVETKQGPIWSPVVVNAGGPLAAQVAATAGITLPVQPYRRQVYVCTNPKDVPPEAPLIVDLASGFYLHQEANGKTVLLGGTDKDTRPGLVEENDVTLAEDFFTAAIDAIPSAINIKWLRTYTGIREMTPDSHPIIGEATELKGLFFVNGFSGHGFMHAPAAGQVAADLILNGTTARIDTNSFRPERFATERLSETYIF